MRRLIWIAAILSFAATALPAVAQQCATMGATELVDGVRYCVDSVLDAQSGNDYGPQNLFDGDRGTAWCEGASGPGTGQRIVLTVSNGAPFDRFFIWNGYQKSRTSFTRNARPRTIVVATDGDPERRYGLPDAPGEIMVRLGRMAERQRVTITIADVYPGTRYNDLCISGLYLDFESGRDAVVDPGPEPAPAPDRDLSEPDSLPPLLPTPSDGAEAPAGGLHEVAPLPDLPGL